MKIAYTFTDKDATLFFREYSSDWRESKRKRGPQSKSWMTLYYFLLLIVPASVFAGVAEVGAGYDVAVMAALPTGFGWQWILNLLWHHWQRNRIRTSPQFVGPHIVGISSKGLSDQRLEGEWVAYWSHLADIRGTKNFLLFIYQNRAVVPIPRYAFQSAGEADQFYRQSQEYWKQGHGVWPPAPRPSNSAEPGDTPPH